MILNYQVTIIMKKLQEKYQSDLKFIKKSFLIAELSDDNKTKVGAYIVKDNVVLSRGYNHSVGVKRKNKNDNMLHAEIDAIVKAYNLLEGGTLYCTLHPCIECAKAIISAGINRVVYSDDIKKHKEYTIKAKELFKKAKIKVDKVTNR